MNKSPNSSHTFINRFRILSANWQSSSWNAVLGDSLIPLWIPGLALVTSSRLEGLGTLALSYLIARGDCMSHVGIRGIVCEGSLCKQYLLCGFNNSSPPGQNGRLFTDNIFRCIFMNEKFYISITISLKFVPTGPIDNDPALIQIMTWCQIGDKPLSEPMLTWFTDTFMRN